MSKINLVRKTKERDIAIKLRQEGKTYSEILNIVPVAKSTLALWLHSVKLAKRQKQRITKERLEGSRRGGEAKKKQRIEKQNKIFLETKSDIKNISKYEFFLIGVCLYWAEGSKEKEYRPGSGVAFSNMDPRMIILFLKWLDKICKIPKDMIGFEITVHASHEKGINEIKQFWSQVTSFPVESFSHVYLKRSKIKKTNRKNTGEKYHGVLKIHVRKSSDLVRKIACWSEAISGKVLKI